MIVLIIDNERHIRKGLIQMIMTTCTGIAELHEADGVTSGLRKIQEVQPHLVFLDVELDDGTAMDLLDRISNINFGLVFITAYNKYAVDAFKFSALDFLLKPIEKEKLFEALISKS